MPSTSLNLSSVLIGFGLAGLSALLMSPDQHPASRDPWPPMTHNIVNVFETPSPVAIPAGGTFTLYTVPSDKWLTLTGTWVSASGATYLAEEYSGVLTRKGLATEFTAVGTSSLLSITPEASGGPVGWTFQPGSRVVLENPPTSGGSSTLTRYALLGYLTRE